MRLLLGALIALTAVKSGGCLARRAGPTAAPAPTADVSVVVTGGSHDLKNVIVRAAVPAAALNGVTDLRVQADGGAMLLCQATPARLLASDPKSQEVVFIVPELKAGETKTYRVLTSFPVDGTPKPFRWTVGNGYEEVMYSNPILRYECAPFDDTSKEARERTFKVFHQVYDFSGEHFLTKGVGGYYPHHRGLFFGFNKVSYGDKKADVWHCTGDAYQSADGTSERTAGTVLGRHRVRVGWHGPGQETFAEEERELTAFRSFNGHLIEFASVVRTRVGPVRLDGDPQHAGFHFRASQEVADQANAKKPETYYLRPDGPGKVGEERNWDPKTKTGPVNQPWDAMVFHVGGKTYTALYLDHPENPKEARSSERAYGRFGTYFEYDLTDEKPLRVQYRVWIQEGEMTVAQCEAMSRSFTDPVKVEVR